jgi:hypothetical protein
MSSIVVNKGNEKVREYHEPIHDFFDSFPLSHARIYLLSACKAAESNHIWNKKPPVDLLFFFESLERLLSAVFAVVKSDKFSLKAVIRKHADTPDLNLHELYRTSTDEFSAWNCFPRSLSGKEYTNPYRVLQKVGERASKKEWNGILRDILHYALGSSSLSELGVNLEMVTISELLLKMLDACHLIDVRLNFQKDIAQSKKMNANVPDR